MIDKKRKTIIFDFGNILINLDYPRCFSAFQEVLGVDFSTGLPDHMKERLFQYERGKITTEAFLWSLQQFNPTAEIRDIIAAWNAVLGEFPMRRLDMILSLRQHYNIALLSNINEMHIQWIDKFLNASHNITDFRTRYFDHLFYSNEIGHRKPDTSIYEYVMDYMDVDKEDILFIDDMAINIEAAIAYGWKGQVHNPEEDITDNIQSYIKKAGFPIYTNEI